jgi:hypothetical protein
MTQIETSLFMLLLLLGLLNAKPPHPRLSIALLTTGIILAFLSPLVKVQIQWEIVVGLTIPILLWQNSRRLFNARWISSYIGVILFLSSILLYSILVASSDNLLWYGSILFGIVAAGIIWRAGESEITSSYFSQLGPLIIIFLLIEVDLALNMQVRYGGYMASGAAIGLSIALLAAYQARRMSQTQRHWVTIGQLYLAYWLAYFMGVSSLTSIVVNIIFFVGLGIKYSLWENNRLSPSPLNSQTGFIILLLLFLFVGWQSHQQLTTRLIIEVIIGSILALIIAWIGIRSKLPSFQFLHTPLSTGIRVTSFLLPALLLWPRGAIHQPSLFLIAVIATGLLLVLTTTLTHFYFPVKSDVEINTKMDT